MNRDADLPPSPRVDVGALARLFDDCVTSYKYFFFLSLLNMIAGKAAGKWAAVLDRPIPLSELAVDMVLAAWYPHGFCKLSLGYRDMLQSVVDTVFEGVPIRGSWIGSGGAEWRKLRFICTAKSEPAALMKYVPFRLLSPFFDRELRGLPDSKKNGCIARLSEELFSERRPLYCFTADRTGIILNHDWLEYLQRNSTILEGWSKYKLAEYLQTRNPNTPAVIEKIAPPTVRESLAPQTIYWREALSLMGGKALCIYSGVRLDNQKISLDHFLPWSFVCHDRVWNLVPTQKSINSSKSNCLPDRKYISHLADIQSAAISALKAAWSDGRWKNAIEPFLSDLHVSLDDVLDKAKLLNAYESTIPPLLSMAELQGFMPGWEYGTGMLQDEP